MEYHLLKTIFHIIPEENYFRQGTLLFVTTKPVGKPCELVDGLGLKALNLESQPNLEQGTEYCAGIVDSQSWLWDCLRIWVSNVLFIDNSKVIREVEISQINRAVPKETRRICKIVS